MTQGFLLLLETLTEAAVTAALGWWLAGRLDMPRAGASLRCCAAAIIATGATHPVMWVWSYRLLEMTGSRWGGLATGQVLVILVETLFYAAALRGHWRLSLMISAVANAVAFGGGLLLSALVAPLK